MKNNVSNDVFVELPTNGPLRQGDIVKLEPGLNTLGMIVTADCDIVQEKAGDELTLLDVVPAETYVRGEWASREAEKLYKRQIRSLLPLLNKALTSRSENLSALDEHGLADWLMTSEPEKITDSIGLSGGTRKDAAKALECISAWVRRSKDQDDLLTLKRIWNALGTNTKTIRARLDSVFDPGSSSGDIFFVPYIPNAEGLGYVIRLRSFKSIKRDNVYKNRMDMRLSGQKSGAYRIAHLSDGLRFSIVQKMSVLFSRIGMSEHFEQESGFSSDLVIEKIHSEIEKD